MAGISVWNGRLPGARQFGCAGSSTKPRPRFCSTMPVPSTTSPEPNGTEQAVDQRHHVAVAVGDRQVYGLARQRLARHRRRERAARIDQRRAAARVLLVEQRRRRHPCVLRVGDEARRGRRTRASSPRCAGAARRRCRWRARARRSTRARSARAARRRPACWAASRAGGSRGSRSRSARPRSSGARRDRRAPRSPSFAARNAAMRSAIAPR